MSFESLRRALLAAMIVACGLAGSIQAPSWAQTTTEYVVQSGDTLLGIAIKLNTSAAALQALNGLSDPNVLRAGQVLKVPAPPTGAGSSTYVVQAGDTLGAIALRFRVSVDALARANRLTDLDKLRVGQQLIIPSAGQPHVALIPLTPDAPAPKAGTATASNDAHGALRAQLLTLYNQARAASGLPPLARSPILEAVAQAHADDCAARGWCSHIGSDGSRASQRIARAGYASRFNGENWAWSRSADQAFDMWYTQEIPIQGPHWKNILSPNYAEVGFGIAAWRGGYFFIANFGGK